MKPFLPFAIALAFAGIGAATPAAASIATGTSAQEQLAIPGKAREMSDREQVEAYLAEVEDIQQGVSRGDYGKLPDADIGRLQGAASTIHQMLDGRSGTQELASSEKMDLYNAQQTFESIIQRQRDTAKVCRRGAKTGTKIATTQCYTVAELERQRRAAQQTANEYMRRPTCTMGPGGSGGNCR